MIANKLCWLGLELLLTGCFLFFGSAGTLALAALLLLLPLLSLPVNLFLCRRLQIRLRAAASVRKGDDGMLTVAVENPSALPVLRFRCRLKAENQLNRESWILTAADWVRPKKNWESTMLLGSAYCGRIRVSVERAVLYDCFGLIGVRCPCGEVCYMTVQPDTFEPDIVLVPNPGCAEDSDLYAQDRPGADMTEVYQIREYVPGDSPRQIHWKLSGKFDRLIVRDPALPIVRNVLVFWERTGDSGRPEWIDAQAETVVSLCRGLLDRGIPLTVGWNDTDRTLCILHELRDLEELAGLIPRILRATGTKEGTSGARLLMQTRSDALCGHMVYIAETLQPEALELRRFGHAALLICGETAPDGATVFDAEHYEQQLAHIEM